MAQCTDGDARIEYIGNGSQRTFTFPFEYLETTDVKVAQYVDEQIKYVNLAYGTDWHFKTPTVVELTVAPTTSIVIYRCTDIDEMQATFYPGNSIKAGDLNIDFSQLRLAIEEGRSGRGWLQDQIQAGKSLWLNRINSDDDEDGLPGDLVKSNSSLTINDEVVATTKWIDNRYWDQCGETTYLSDTWVDEIDDTHIPTTGAVERRLVEVIEDGGFGTTSVISVNGQTGVVELTASNVGALPDTYTPPPAPVSSVNGKTGAVSLKLGNLTDVETGSTGHIPTNGQALIWDQGMDHWMPGDVDRSGITEAPDDGKQYGRQNDSWTEILSSGGGGDGDSGLWQQSGTILSPVTGADNLSIPNNILTGGTVTINSAESGSVLYTDGGVSLSKQRVTINSATGNFSVGDKAYIFPADGSITAAGAIEVGNRVFNSNTNYGARVQINDSADSQYGGFYAQNNGSNTNAASNFALFEGRDGSNVTFDVRADGSITAAGQGTFSSDLRVQDGGNFRVRNANNASQDAVLLENNGNITAAGEVQIAPDGNSGLYLGDKLALDPRPTADGKEGIRVFPNSFSVSRSTAGVVFQGRTVTAVGAGTNNYTSTIYGDGSASFAGSIKANTKDKNKVFFVSDFNGSAYVGFDEDTSLANINLLSDGSASFSGRVGVNTPPNAEARFACGGTVAASGVTLSSDITNINSTKTIQLNGSDGSADFAGQIIVDTSASSSNSSYAGTFVNSRNGTPWQAAIFARNATAGGPVWAGVAHDFTGSNGKVTSNIFEDGSATFGTGYKVGIRPFDGDNADQFYIKKTDGTQTVGFTGGGSATFASTLVIAPDDGRQVELANSPTGGAIYLRATDGTRNILIDGSTGSASFTNNSSTFGGINGGSAVFYGGDSSTTNQNNAKFRLNTNGSATFAGNVTANGYSMASLTQL